ncbi:hypothetical protein LTR91_006720 [Friedmanniomyces endolithicus]|uniref:Uncharacterized protein n=1 Tax=Friedmanniomyces endolithicus TaxID=329885 RepID=A0AAN6KR74_9PEZI|nr:hypothetical protein LTR94_023483 [Friedmanniomyces endolithicus]KAK0770435.1 hypothetical protein LTR75_017913 [Friedmanniomyces endolithicus]KAK0798974.1 hypothetical protein LTR59_006220 [Friedmanniomyces endolithicus]KAK0803541.1 hypothetical protein LTR38_006115 [Friedmanniomyces endolithicus]KAK0840397.1 hypothetical protein LTR03_010623 [Friedmanniomyces endolithicus]
MPEKWDAQKDQKLLLIILEQNHINYRKVAETWSEKYGTEVSNRAIIQHLQKLAKDVGNAGGVTPDGGKSATATPSKPAARVVAKTPSKTPTKTPGSAGKRRQAAMSDQDDSEDERTMNGSASVSPSKRIKVERRSGARKSYREVISNDEDAGEEVLEHGELDDVSEMSDYNPEPTLT